MAKSNSPLVTYTNLTKNKTTVKNKINDTITIHCFVGQVTAKRGCDHFANQSKNSSTNYVVGKDGDIGLSVNEWDRAWTTGGGYKVNGESGRDNDFHAITIEVACDVKHPYAVTDAAYNALIKLVADIAKRNNMGELKWKADKNLVTHPDKQNMTVHRWFAAKACPGDYLYDRMGDIAAKANAINQTEEYKTVDYNVEVTATEGLNCRTSPQVINNPSNKVKTYPYKTQLHISKETSDNWGYTGEGWINLQYTKKVENPMNEMEQAMQWGVEEGLIKGDETGNLMPKEPMTREQAMTVLKRFYDKFL